MARKEILLVIFTYLFPASYTVKFKTGTGILVKRISWFKWIFDGPGTNAAVTLVLYGSKGNSSPIRLPTSSDHMERGKWDIFITSSEFLIIYLLLPLTMIYVYDETWLRGRARLTVHGNLPTTTTHTFR